MGKSEFVGVDGCRSGWFSVGFDLRGCYELKVFPAFSELHDYYAEAKLVLVDIPIGLMEGPGGRKCDQEARKLLKGRSSSVFTAPTRQTVGQAAKSSEDKKPSEDKRKAAYVAANEIERRITNKGISWQSFAIARKMYEVEEVLKHRNPNTTPKVREVHPEVCFWALNGKTAMSHRKKIKMGREERIRVLECVEPQTKVIYKQALNEFRRKCVAKDDILDALVAAVTARCGYGRLKTIPESPAVDSNGLAMEMVYFEG